MKTAISLPDRLFQDADRTAKRMGISRSELVQKALEAFLKQYDDSAIAESYNRVYGPGGEVARVDPVLRALSLKSLSSVDWQ